MTQQSVRRLGLSCNLNESMLHLLSILLVLTHAHPYAYIQNPIGDCSLPTNRFSDESSFFHQRSSQNPSQNHTLKTDISYGNSQKSQIQPAKIIQNRSQAENLFLFSQASQKNIFVSGQKKQSKNGRIQSSLDSLVMANVQNQTLSNPQKLNRSKQDLQSSTFQQQDHQILALVQLNTCNQNKKIITFGLTVLVGFLVFVVVKQNQNHKIQQKEIDSLKQKNAKKTEDLKSIQCRLQQLKKLKEMPEQSSHYEIYWQKLVYSYKSKCSFQHRVYQGRFLNQDTFVYQLTLDCSHAQQKIVDKLNILMSCSHISLTKLYFYIRTQQKLLIFTEKIKPLAFSNVGEYLDHKLTVQAKKSVISRIIETLSFLEERIQLKWLPLTSVQLMFEQNTDNMTFKINPIPCLFRNMEVVCKAEEADTCSQDITSSCFVRFDMVCLFHLILFQGKPFSKYEFDYGTYNGTHQHQEYFQFIDFLLNQAKAIGHTHELLFQQALGHPFLWNTQRKMLFISDFSNFVETHLDETKRMKLQRFAKDYIIFDKEWLKQFHESFKGEVSKYRKYDFSSFRDLVRMIRNKVNHFHQIPKNVRTFVGQNPQRFVEYSLSLFPKLLHFSYMWTRKKKWRLHIQ